MSAYPKSVKDEGEEESENEERWIAGDGKERAGKRQGWSWEEDALHISNPNGGAHFKNPKSKQSGSSLPGGAVPRTWYHCGAPVTTEPFIIYFI